MATPPGKNEKVRTIPPPPLASSPGAVKSPTGSIKTVKAGPRLERRAPADAKNTSIFGVAVRDVARLREVAGVVVRHGFGEFVLRMPFASALLGRELVSRKETFQGTAPERFAHLLGELGPTYIKLGQVLSMRSDLLPREYIEALSKLQDKAPEITFEEVKRVIEQGLGRPVDEVFAELDPEPLATASIGQTHRGKTKEGVVVAVKVQRPGIDAVMRGDLDLLWLAAKGLEASIDELNLVMPSAIVAEFEKSLLRELNFSAELANLVTMDRLVRNVGEKIVVPKPLAELSCRTVLTMEFFEGKPVRTLEPKSEQARRAVEVIVKAMCQGVFVDGFFHGDPHAGNILVGEDGTLCFLDLGLVGTLSPEQRDDLVTLVLGTIMNDASTVCRVLLKIGTATERIDIGDLKADITRVRAQYVMVSALKDVDTERFIEEFIAATRKYKVRLATEYSVLAKAAGTIEGMIRSLYPDLDFIPLIKPYVERVFADRFEPQKAIAEALGGATGMMSLARTLPTHLDQILHDLETGNMQVRPRMPELEQLPSLLHDSATRIGVAVFAASMSIASAMVVPDGYEHPMEWVKIGLFFLFAIAATSGWAVVWFWHWLGRGFSLPIGGLLRLLRRG
ncbi:MAG: AarF/ABC1/UbiB kinase family protein [Deltaproteobacteria bacterium]|nr:AarF/ABC1/UbiB kinase family protein [Deltaproteobacteria bacterium]